MSNVPVINTQNELTSFLKTCTICQPYYSNLPHKTCVKINEFIIKYNKSEYNFIFDNTNNNIDTFIHILLVINSDKCMLNINLIEMYKFINNLQLTETHIVNFMKNEKIIKFLKDIVSSKKINSLISFEFLPKLKSIYCNSVPLNVCNIIIEYVDTHTLTENDALVFFGIHMSEKLYSKYVSKFTITQKIFDLYINSGQLYMLIIQQLLTASSTIVLNNDHLNKVLSKYISRNYSNIVEIDKNNKLYITGSNIFDMSIIYFLLDNVELSEHTYLVLLNNRIKFDMTKYKIQPTPKIINTCLTLQIYPYKYFNIQPKLEDLYVFFNSRTIIEMYHMFKKYHFKYNLDCVNYVLSQPNDCNCINHAIFFMSLRLVPNTDVIINYFSKHMREQSQLLLKQILEYYTEITNSSSNNIKSSNNLLDQLFTDIDNSQNQLLINFNKLVINETDNIIDCVKQDNSKLVTNNSSNIINNIMTEFNTNSIKTPIKKSKTKNNIINKNTEIDLKKTHTVTKEISKVLNIKNKKITVLEFKNIIIDYIITNNLITNTCDIIIDKNLNTLLSYKKKTCSFTTFEQLIEDYF